MILEKPYILVTGLTGYIGSHTTVRLLEEGYKVVGFDNLHNSSIKVIERIQEITGRQIEEFREMDLRDKRGIEQIFSDYEIGTVIHFAGLKAVGESVEKPDLYYENNVIGSLNLYQAMIHHGVMSIVFSSSATVYGNTNTMPLTEDNPTPSELANPYANTKRMNEIILHDLQKAGLFHMVTVLRYFNPIGAHPTARIGECPKGVPNNLMPYITQVALGIHPALEIYGDDYEETRDHTPERDYIHIMDLADIHVLAAKHQENNPGYVVANVGTGVSIGVLELVKAFSLATGISLPCTVIERRMGDVPVLRADPTKAQELFGWKAKRTIEEMCRDSWNWQTQNPNGYD